MAAGRARRRRARAATAAASAGRTPPGARAWVRPSAGRPRGPEPVWEPSAAPARRSWLVRRPGARTRQPTTVRAFAGNARGLIYVPPMPEYNLANDLLFRHVDEGRGDRIAVIDDEGSYTYAQVAARARKVASAL